MRVHVVCVSHSIMGRDIKFGYSNQCLLNPSITRPILLSLCVHLDYVYCPFYLKEF